MSLNLFVPASSEDPWDQKIRNWQARHRLDPARRGELVRVASPLSSAYVEFSERLRREIVAQAIDWVQGQSRSHYRPDGDRDHWATLGEVIETGGDDCDGLDLLTFNLLRGLGFGTEEIYRAIVVEKDSGQHHMVTLWFEGGVHDDPYVLDPTGVVTTKMVRLSAIGGWEPIELFDEKAHFKVEPRTDGAAVAGR